MPKFYSEQFKRDAVALYENNENLSLAAAAAVASGEFSMYGQVGEIVDGYRRVDNITDAIAKEYRASLGSDVSRDDIFGAVANSRFRRKRRIRYQSCAAH